MKRWIVLLVAVLGCGPSTPPSSAPPGSAASHWKNAGAEDHLYKDEAGAFTIKFPVSFTIDVKRDVVGSSELVTTTAAATTHDERVNYIAVKTVIDPAVQYDCEKGIASTRDKTLQAFGCKVTSEKPLSHPATKWPGHEVTFECNKTSLTGMLQVYCDASTVATDKKAVMYEVFAASSRVVWSEPDARNFLGSFTPAVK